ncbi:hypothetical protein [Rubinisphaera margarita]|uniref:hypothetical protein n=1 Tax=Rubinisphaera margarita TaxID=2909586 RepID=UPI001EE86721|nr:hypothetical protein [Rubinisphaera margarita]MCG6156348.1 hypothetical protein [Rubinisphaera margarita]
MTAETSPPTYCHVQKAPLCLPIYAFGVGFLWVSWFGPDVPPIPWLFPPIGLMVLLLAGSFHHLTVVGQGDEMQIRFGPIPIFHRTVQYSEIASVVVGRTTLLEGWGIHKNIRGAWVWNLWGRDCVVVHFKSEGALKIGTDDAGNLAEFLNAKIH